MEGKRGGDFLSENRLLFLCVRRGCFCCGVVWISPSSSRSGFGVGCGVLNQKKAFREG